MLIGLYSPDSRIDGWGDLDGDVSEYRGWWIRADELELCIEDSNIIYEVVKPLEYKGQDLKGKTCRILTYMRDGQAFVEFDEDVHGCSADGLGKSGHCIAVNCKVLAPQKKKREKHAE